MDLKMQTPPGISRVGSTCLWRLRMFAGFGQVYAKVKCKNRGIYYELEFIIT